MSDPLVISALFNGTRARQAELALKYRGRGGYAPVRAAAERAACSAAPLAAEGGGEASRSRHVAIRDEVVETPQQAVLRALARDSQEAGSLRPSASYTSAYRATTSPDCRGGGRGGAREGECRGWRSRMAKALKPRHASGAAGNSASGYHAHVLRSPTEVARAVAYVLGNYSSPRSQVDTTIARGQVDPYSSAANMTRCGRVRSAVDGRATSGSFGWEWERGGARGGPDDPKRAGESIWRSPKWSSVGSATIGVSTTRRTPSRGW